MIDDICFCAKAHRHENPDNIGFDTPFLCGGGFPWLLKGIDVAFWNGKVVQQHQGLRFHPAR
ncbi:hypothetical protein F2981_17380 [Sinorhizobium meliloti]|nr:hypothetical protein [Sinorhizobium meliloti]